MKVLVHDEELGDILYEESLMTGRKELTIGGEKLTKVSKKEFKLADERTATVSGGFAVGAKLNVGGRTIRLTPAIKWYEVVLCVLPLILVLVWGNSVTLCKVIPIVGGAIGGAIGGLMSALGFFFIKTAKPLWLKMVLAVAFLAATFGICCGIAFAILDIFA